MLGRRGWNGLLVAALLAACAAPGRAHAWHDEGTEIVVDTAYTLPQGDVRLGIWRLDVGIFDELDVGTYHWLWLVPMPNAQAEVRLWHDDRWALSVRTGIYYFDTGLVFWTDIQSDASLVVFPVELRFSMPIADDWGLTIGSSWTTVGIRGTYDPDEFAGAAAVDNLQLALMGYWRAGRVVALLLTLRWLAFERARGDARLNVRIDEYTTAEIVGAASAQQESVRNAAYLMLSSVFSWESFNLRVGLGVGNYNLPSLNLMLPKRTLVGELDLYWRF